MAITDLGHLALGCRDLDASLAFYALLGIEESFRLTREDGSVILVYCHIAGDRFIELFPGGPDAADRAESKAQSFKHICLVSDDLVNDIEHLRQHGVTIDVEPKVGLDANTQAWFKDPDGNAIELMQLSPISPQKAVSEGREPVIPDPASLGL